MTKPRDARTEIEKLDDEMLRLTLANMREQRNLTKWLQTNDEIYALQVKRRELINGGRNTTTEERT